MTEAGMRSTENVRGEWDELGERDTRVIVPGPGPGDGQDERLTEVLPVTDATRTADARETGVPGPGGEPDPAPAEERPARPGAERPARPGEDAAAPADADPGAAAPAVTGTPAGAAAPAVVVVPVEAHGPAGAEGPSPADGLRVNGLRVEGLPVDGSPVDGLPVDDDEIPADLGPALDAVAVVGRTPAPAGIPVDLDLELELQLDPEPPQGPEFDPEPTADWELPGPVPAPAWGARPYAGEEKEGAAPSEPKAGPPELRKPLPGGTGVPAGGERAPVTLTVGAADPVAWWGAGRRQPVIATETTAPIPVHLLFRDEGHDAGQGGTGRTAEVTGAARRSGERRPPLQRSAQAPASGRTAPLADPRLTERPGPALPGWAALLTAAAGVSAGLAVLWWQGAVPVTLAGRLGLAHRPYDGLGSGAWALLSLLAAVALFALCGLGRGRAGHASVLTLFGDYRGSVRRTGLLWISPLLLRRRVDVRLRHWRSEPLPAVDASGTALRAVVLVVWRVRDTARAVFGVADHEHYLSDQVEAALARVLSQLPADAFHEDTRTLRDAEAVGDALTRMLAAECAPVGIEVYSAQPTGIEYAPEVAAAMQRCRVAAIDAKHRDGVLTSVVDAVDDTVGRLTARGIVELDAYEHKALVRDLTVAFYTSRSGGEGA
ncbi:SPFH domain-containing protein [Streptomyces sp. NPDC058193]|uniref:SPFH domain-containing protein n=1 Tax=Streptomyces sp. NPDC058193 TaxID=3346373 RepID=UPI0036F15633